MLELIASRKDSDLKIASETAEKDSRESHA